MVADPTPGNAAFVQDQMRVKMAPMLDALARLLVLVIRFAADNAPNIKAGWMRDPGIAVSKMVSVTKTVNIFRRLTLLFRFQLGIIAGVMFSHQDNYDVQFLAYPFHRIIYSFFMDLFINEFKFVAIQVGKYHRIHNYSVWEMNGGIVVVFVETFLIILLFEKFEELHRLNIEYCVQKRFYCLP